MSSAHRWALASSLCLQEMPSDSGTFPFENLFIFLIQQSVTVHVYVEESDKKISIMAVMLSHESLIKV